MAKQSRHAELGAQAADLEQAWQDRLADANAALAVSRHALTISSGLYAMEILLKRRVCSQLNVGQLPRLLEIHDLFGLATFAGLRNTLDDPSFKTTKIGLNWRLLVDRSEELNDLRYYPDSRWSDQDALDLLTCLQDPVDGVIAWLRLQP
ncbi:hypothetical protein [Aquisphaera insulae]|uniref:hypothetical protein n=1 Tax=Aquisphaera insulae TaxID=2712864 RepID=UPI0013EA54B9|nr:hypothetical protein [Aquisphaera insulae]